MGMVSLPFQKRDQAVCSNRYGLHKALEFSHTMRMCFVDLDNQSCPVNDSVRNFYGMIQPEGVWLGDHIISLLLLADDVVLVTLLN